MLLITVKEWLGKNSRLSQKQREECTFKATESIIAFATCLPFIEAINKIIGYQKAFNNRSTYLAINFQLLQVSIIDDLTNQQLQDVGLELIEDLSVDDKI